MSAGRIGYAKSCRGIATREVIRFGGMRGTFGEEIRSRKALLDSMVVILTKLGQRGCTIHEFHPRDLRHGDRHRFRPRPALTETTVKPILTCQAGSIPGMASAPRNHDASRPPPPRHPLPVLIVN